MSTKEPTTIIVTQSTPDIMRGTTISTTAALNPEAPTDKPFEGWPELSSLKAQDETVLAWSYWVITILGLMAAFSFIALIGAAVYLYLIPNY